MWVARDKDGTLTLHSVKPILSETEVWYNPNNIFEVFVVKENFFPELTFENSPMEVELKIKDK